jgi:hypothetical protein
MSRVLKSYICGAALAVIALPAAASTVLFTESEVGTYSASFVAEGHHTDITISGLGGAFLLKGIALLDQSQQNLLVPLQWTLTHSAPSNLPEDFGSLSGTGGGGSNELFIATTFFTDTFSQVVATTQGQTYTLFVTDASNELGGGGQSGRFGSWTASEEGIPEPASWALMISGFGVSGAALRRRRATATA